MSKLGVVATVVVIGGIAAGTWAWRVAVETKQAAEHGQSSADGGQSVPPAGDADPAAVSEGQERRFSIVFRPSGSSDKSGSLTLEEAEKGFMRVFAERPGDELTMSLSAGGGLQTAIGTADGSEVRFLGTLQTAFGEVTGEKNGRLAFRKVDGDWAYVSGLGKYEEDGNVTMLGHGRTVESCLDLLDSEDPILREGGARDLGRLAGPEDAERVVPRLVAMLQDSSVHVRHGAIEGLGLIGTAGAAEALYAARANETDDTTREFFDEALAFCAVYAILGEAGAPAEPPEEGLDRVIERAKGSSDSDTKVNGWLADNLLRRVKDRRQEALAALEKAKSSRKRKVSRVAKLLEEGLRARLEESRKQTSRLICVSGRALC